MGLLVLSICHFAIKLYIKIAKGLLHEVTDDHLVQGNFFSGHEFRNPNDSSGYLQRNRGMSDYVTKWPMKLHHIKGRVHEYFYHVTQQCIKIFCYIFPREFIYLFFHFALKNVEVIELTMITSKDP